MKSDECMLLTREVIDKEYDDVTEIKGSKSISRGYWSALIVAFVNVSTGCVFAFTSPALPDMNRNSFRLSSDEQAWTCSIVNVGAFVACLFGGRSVQVLGRKVCLLVSTVLLAVGWSLIVAADGLSMLLAGRFVTGMCLGLCFILVPGYLAEITTAKERDSIGAYSYFCLDFGLLVVHFFGIFLSWRYLALLCMAVVSVTTLMLLYVPESPRWLLSRGRMEQARQTLSWLRADDNDEVKREFQTLQRHLDCSATNNFPVSHLFSKDVRKPLLLSTILLTFMMLSGVDYVWYFTLSIFEASGVKLDAHLQTNLFALAGLAGCVTSVVVTNRFSRKMVLMLTAALEVISLVALGAFFWMTREPATAAVTREHLYWLPLTSLFVYQFSYSVGWGPLPFIIMNEMLPTRARSLATSVIGALTWLLVMVVIIVAVKIARDSPLGNHGLFWIFAACTAAGIVFVALCIPETKGKSLEEIEDDFQD